MSTVSINHLEDRIREFARKKLIRLPTPFHKLERLSRHLGGPQIFLKRDDLTGLAFGGNKSRKLEFIIPDVLKKKADVVITWAGIQSNWCLQTAAAARMSGIKPILILFKPKDLSGAVDGNLLLDFILDADIRIREVEKGAVISMEEATEVLEEAVCEAKEWGHTPYIVPIGGSMPGGSMEKPLGAISYVNAILEIQEQASTAGIEIDYIIHASGSGGTQAGLAAGAKAMGRKTKVLGVSVSEEKRAYSRDVLSIAGETVRCLGFEVEMTVEDIIIFDEYIGPGYGVMTPEVAEAVRLAAVKEGIFLDPVYTGKTLVALMDLAGKGYFRAEDNVVLLHTGGTPALFPYREAFTRFLEKGSKPASPDLTEKDERRTT